MKKLNVPTVPSFSTENVLTHVQKDSTSTLEAEPAKNAQKTVLTVNPNTTVANVETTSSKATNKGASRNVPLDLSPTKPKWFATNVCLNVNLVPDQKGVPLVETVYSN